MSPTEFTHSPVIPIAAPFDLTDYPELAGISAITGTGLVARTGTGTYATRTIAVPAAGITISNAGGVAGNPTLALANDLAALEALSSTGIAVRSTTDTWVQRTITGTTNQVNVSNGDGVSGNPTLSTPQNIHTAATPTFAGLTLSGMTSGSVLFAGTSGVVSQDNSNLYWDDTNNRLGIGVASPAYPLDIVKTGVGTSSGFRVESNYSSVAYSYFGNFGNYGTILGHNRDPATGTFYNNASSPDQLYGVSLRIGGTANGAATGIFSVGNYPSGTYVNRLGISVSGNVLVGHSTETSGGGLIQLATGTTAANGVLWGTDTNLYRSAANKLKTDDSLVVSSGLSVSTLTTGSIPYIGAGGAIEDNNANLFWNNGGTSLLIRSNSIGTNGALQVNGTVGVGSSGTNYIRPITNADVVSLILLATQVVVGNVNSDTYSYSGGGRLAVVTNSDSHTLLDVGRNTSTDARFKIVNTSSGQAYTTFENSTITAFRSFTVTGETIFGASSLATGEGRIHVAPHTTKAGGLYFGAANTNLYSSASGALKTDGVLTIAGTTASTSSTTGALIVSGGVGIAKALYVANDLVVTPTASANRAVTITGSNGGNPTIGTSAGSLAITSASGATYFNASSGNTDGTIYIRPTGTGVYSSVQFRSATDTGTAQLICDSGTALYLDSAAGNYTRIRSGGYTHVRVGATASANRYLIFDGSNGGNPTIDVSAGSLAITPATVFASTITTIGGATFHTTSTALTNGAGAGAGTLTNAPAAGDPTKWIGINDNGTTRYIPAW